MGRALSGGGRCRACRSLLAAASPASADARGDRRADRRLRRQRWTGKQIAAELGVSPATVSRILKRLGLSRLRDLEPAEPVRRYERERPGELIHLDIKKLGRFEAVGHRITGDRRQGACRGAGWEFVHVCIDDASRIAFAQILPDEKKESATAFLKAAVAYYRSLGVTVARVMTDNGSCYRSRLPRRLPRSRPQAHPHQALHAEDQRQGRTLHPDRPARVGLRPGLSHSDRRAAELPVWLHRYNWHRPHGSLKSKTPISRLGLSEDNLLRPAGTVVGRAEIGAWTSV